MNHSSVSPPGDDRRGFLAKAVAVVCGVAACAAPAAAGLVAFLNPLRRKVRRAGLRRLTPLDVLPRTAARASFPFLPSGATPGTPFPTRRSGPCSFVAAGRGKSRRFRSSARTPAASLPSTRRATVLLAPAMRPAFDISGKRLDPAGFAQPARSGHSPDQGPQWQGGFGKVKNFRTGTSREDRRIMNAFLSWIDERTGLCSAAHDWLGRPVAGGPAWRNVWPDDHRFHVFHAGGDGDRAVDVL